MFVLQISESIKINMKLPIIERVYSVGAIFMSNNLTTTSHTNHIDIYTKYVNKCVEDGVIKVVLGGQEKTQAIT